MRPSHGHPSQECAATQRESQASEDIGAIAPPVERGWGRLWPLTQNLTHVDLKAEEVRLGRRPTCAVVLDARMLPASVFGSVVTLISGDHCRIYREGTTTVDENAIPTFIEDLSSNGTFINYQKLGKGEHKLLKHGDRIDLVRPTRCSDTAPVAYMFEEFFSLNKSFKDHEKALGGQYTLSRELGAGNFSRVYHGYRNGKTEVALKCIDKRRFWSTPKTKEQLLREADILREVKHPNIITVYDVIDSEQFLYLVLELASGGELFDMIRQRGNITEDEARSIFKQMFSAVAYLHKRGIAHRDLKPENILFSSKEAGSPVKITDFGLARIIGENVPSGTLCGTPQYVAPEIISLSSTPAESRRGYGVAVDMWSLGVMLYVLLSGIFPFDEAVRPGSLFQQIELGTYDFPPEYFHSVSAGAKELIRSLLKVNPAERIIAEAALAHPWITQPPSAQPTVLSLGRASSNHKADDTPDKAKPTVDTDDEGSGGTKRTRRETLEAEQFSPEIIKSFRLKIPATPLERKKLTFST